MDYWNHKYLKYKLKYQALKNGEATSKLSDLQGGAAKKKTEKQVVKADKKPKAEKVERAEDNRPSVYVKCVNVMQKKEDLHFEGRVCKTPPLRIRVADDATMARIVKIALRFVSKRARMSDVDEVEIVRGKKKEKMAGDKLDQPVDMADIDEINIKMH